MAKQLTVLRCRGVGEYVGEHQMLAYVTRNLDERFVIKDVPWLASYGLVPKPLGSSLDRGLRDGRELLLKMIRDDPNPVILLGYSGGAALAGNVAAEIGNGDHPGLDIRAVGLIADPLRPYGFGPEPDPMARTWGIAGSRRVFSRTFPVWWASDPADVIACCPEGSPLRTLSDQSAAFSLVDPLAWYGDLGERLRSSRWQETVKDWRNAPAVWRAYSKAVDGVRGYLGGDHTSYHRRFYPGTTRTYCEWLADRINEVRT